MAATARDTLIEKARIRLEEIEQEKRLLHRRDRTRPALQPSLAFVEEHTGPLKSSKEIDQEAKRQGTRDERNAERDANHRKAVRQSFRRHQQLRVERVKGLVRTPKSDGKSQQSDLAYIFDLFGLTSNRPEKRFSPTERQTLVKAKRRLEEIISERQLRETRQQKRHKDRKRDV